MIGKKLACTWEAVGRVAPQASLCRESGLAAPQERQISRTSLVLSLHTSQKLTAYWWQRLMQLKVVTRHT